MANGYGSSSGSSSSSRSATTRRREAPAGFHYMPDGALMSDAEHARLYGQEVGAKTTNGQVIGMTNVYGKIIGYSDSGNANCACEDGKTYPNCGGGCECCNTVSRIQIEPLVVDSSSVSIDTSNLKPPYIGACYSSATFASCAESVAHNTVERLYMDQREDNYQMTYGITSGPPNYTPVTSPVPIISSYWNTISGVPGTNPTPNTQLTDNFLFEQSMAWHGVSSLPQFQQVGSSGPYGMPWKNGCNSLSGHREGWSLDSPANPNVGNYILEQSQIPGHVPANTGVLGNPIPITSAVGGSLFHFQWWEYQAKIEWTLGMEDCCKCNEISPDQTIQAKVVGINEETGVITKTLETGEIIEKIISTKVGEPEKYIETLDFDLTDIPSTGATKKFNIIGDDGAEFKLEIKDNTTGYYYNFPTSTFQQAYASLDGSIRGNSYKGFVKFPSSVATDTVNGAVSAHGSDNSQITMDTAVATKMKVGDRVTGGDIDERTVLTVESIDSEFVFTINNNISMADGATLTFTGDNQYDIYLHAKPGTIHVARKEFRFADGSIDINSSSGSESLLLQKVIYQYRPFNLNLYTISPSNVVISGSSKNIFTTEKNTNKAKTAFSTTISGAGIRILKQPISNDFVSFLEGRFGTDSITLPGENIYPSVSNTDTVDGIVSNSNKIVMDTNVADKMKVGDRVTGTGISSSATVTVTHLNPDGTNAKEFQVSEAVSISDGVTLSFSNQMNHAFSVTNYANLIKPGMISLGTSVFTVKDYVDSVTLFEGTPKEQVVVKSKRKAVDTFGKTPTITKGRITTQEGVVIFDSQQVFDSTNGGAFKIGGYGEGFFQKVSGWNIKLTDLKIELVPKTTTTTSIVSDSTTIAVADRAGTIQNFSTISGMGIGVTHTDTVDGAVSGDIKIVMDNNVAGHMKIGDIVKGDGIPKLSTVTVVALNPDGDNVKEFSVSEKVTISDGVTLSFTPQSSPLITSSYASGAGNWTVDMLQKLKSNAKLTIENTSTAAILTGNIEVLEAGFTDITIRLDVDKVLSLSAP